MTSSIMSRMYVPLRTYRNDPSSKHREIGQSDDITGFQLMHLFPGKLSGAGGNLLGGSLTGREEKHSQWCADESYTCVCTLKSDFCVNLGLVPRARKSQENQL